MPQLTDALFKTFDIMNPYEGFDYKKIVEDTQGEAEHSIFKQVIDQISPRVVLEVGTWKGNSAIHMASLLKEKKLDATIICIDTWLGGLEHMTNFKKHPKWGLHKYLVHGYPSLYYQFLANVMYHQMEGYILPIPNTTAVIASFLRHHNISADLIYIDAGHDEDSVYEDIKNYWRLLKKGGVMIGDDWHVQWYGVICAVNRFSREQNVAFQVVDTKWVMQKPDS